MSESAPGIAEIVRHFSWDLPWLLFLGGAAAGYIVSLRRSRNQPACSQQGSRRAVAFIAGIVGVAIAVLSPLEHYGNRLLMVDFAGFLILTMVAPPLILLGAPLTLAFRVSNKTWRARLKRAYKSRWLAAISFPVFTWLAFAVVTYLWQFSSLTDRAAQNVFVRDFQQASLLAVALLFWQPVIAADPQRWRLPYPLRALYVFVEMTHKALFGAMFLAMNHPMHHYFAANIPSWGPEPMTDQRTAILILWIGGNLIFLGVLGILVAGWVEYEQRNAERVDRRLALAREAELIRRCAVDKVFQKPV